MDTPRNPEETAENPPADPKPASKVEEPILRLILKSSDAIEIAVDEDVASQSRLLRQMIEDLQLTADSPILKEPIPCPNVDGETLHRIIDWCIIHRGEEFVPKGEHDDPRVLLTEEDHMWMDVSSDELLSMLSAANYLDIPGIVDIITQRVADMACGLTIEELRECFHLENDFTPEEKADIKRRFAWIEA